MARLAAVLNVSVAWLSSGRVADHENILKVPGIGARLERARQRQGLSARAVATASGLGRSAENIRRIERGDTYPTWTTVCRVAGVLGRNPLALAYGN